MINRRVGQKIWGGAVRSRANPIRRQSMSSPAPEIAPIDLKEKIEQQVRDGAIVAQTLYLRRSLGGISAFLAVSAIGTIFSSLRTGLAIGLCVWLVVWMTSMADLSGPGRRTSSLCVLFLNQYNKSGAATISRERI